MDSKTLCLAVLLKGEASGYEIKKTLESPPLSHFQDTGFSSIYPALTRLTEEGHVVVQEQPQDRRPDKKVYSITPAGHAALMEALREPPGPDRYRSDFLFVLTFAELLPRGAVLKIIDSRLAELEETLTRMEACACEAMGEGHRLVHGYGLALYRAAHAYLKEQRALLEARAEREVAE